MAWAPDYATLAEMKAYHRIADTLDDAQLALAIGTASRIVDQITSRQFGNLTPAQTWIYRADDIGWSQSLARWVIRVDDIHDVTGLNVTVAGSTPATVEFDPPNAIAKGRPVERLHVRTMGYTDGRPGPATVTALFGWSATPTAVTQATLLQTARLIRRREAPFGIAGSPDAGSEMRLLAMADPDVVVALKDYRRDWPRI